METPAMDEFLVSIFHLKYVIDDIGGNNDEHRLYVFHTPGIKIITLCIIRGGGTGGVGPPLELDIYLLKFLKNRKKKFFFSIGPP